MKKILLVFITVMFTFIYCDARQDCYDDPNKVRIRAGDCELITNLTYLIYSNNNIEIPGDLKMKLFLLCNKQERDRKTCDNKSQYWPLPKNFNQGKNRGL